MTISHLVGMQKVELNKDAMERLEELQDALTRSLLISALSTLEFALKQACEAEGLTEKKQGKEMQSAVERYARTLLGDDFPVLHDHDEEAGTDDWERLFAFVKARAMFTHSLGYQDRALNLKEIKLLSRMEIVHALQVRPPQFRMLFCRPNSVGLVSALMISLLRKLEEKLRLQYANP